jgi:hypothetical protein
MRLLYVLTYLIVVVIMLQCDVKIGGSNITWGSSGDLVAINDSTKAYNTDLVGKRIHEILAFPNFECCVVLGSRSRIGQTIGKPCLAGVM